MGPIGSYDNIGVLFNMNVVMKCTGRCNNAPIGMTMCPQTPGGIIGESLGTFNSSLIVH